MRSEKNDFTRGSMWGSIVRMAIPMTLAQLVNVLYSVVDRMYIGHIPEIGSLALTSLGLTMPVILIVSAFASLCGTGGGALCSIARGEGDREKAERIMANAFTMLIVLSIILTLASQLFMKPILYFFGASDGTYAYAADYLRIYMAGTLFAMISLGMNSFINAQGFGTTGMLTVCIGAAVNIILDPIFIFTFGMGIRGAAIATMLAQFFSAAWAMKFLLGDKVVLDLKLKNMRLQPGVVRDIAALGVTSFVSNATGALVQIVCNNQLQSLGGDLYVGAMTIIFSVREITHLVIQGMAAGAQPVLGYNYGAKQYGRVKSGIWFITVFCVVYSFITWAVLMFVPKAMVMIFNDDPALLEVTIPSMRIYFCGMLFMALQASGQNIHLSLGLSKPAIFFAFLRKVFIVVPLALLLPGIPALGVNGVFWSEPISDVISGVLCYISMYINVYRKMDLCEAAKMSVNNTGTEERNASGK